MFKRMIISLALAGMIVPAWSPAEAAPKRVSGERCAFPRVSQGTWVGFFDGYEAATDVFTLRDSRRHITVWRCFRTKANCTAWKYWMQTDYRAGPQLTWCRRK
ncbi:MAG: hypothetical protein WCC66_14790 [Rhizobiaceae bacterium]